MGLTQKLGTIPLAIQTDSSNNVGIGGAANASYKLDVIGTTRVSNALTISSTTNAALIAATNSTTGYTYLDLINNGASGKNYQIGVGGNAAAAGYANNLYFDLVGVGNIMTLTSGRNVGIGTSSPTSAARVEIVSGYTAGLYVRCTNNEVPVSLISESVSVSTIGFKGNTSTNEYNVRCGANGNDFIAYTSNTERMRITSGGIVSMYGDLYVGGQGYKPGGGSWANSSDIRLKENVKTIENALDKVLQLRGVTFDWKEGYTENGKKESGGFIADEVMEVFPDWVTETNATDAQKEIVNDDKIKSLSLPFSFDALLVEAIKELSAKVTALENK